MKSNKTLSRTILMHPSKTRARNYGILVMWPRNRIMYEDTGCPKARKPKQWQRNQKKKKSHPSFRLNNTDFVPFSRKEVNWKVSFAFSSEWPSQRQLALYLKSHHGGCFISEQRAVKFKTVSQSNLGSLEMVSTSVRLLAEYISLLPLNFFWVRSFFLPVIF